jgi:hypothetical protein
MEVIKKISHAEFWIPFCLRPKLASKPHPQPLPNGEGSLKKDKDEGSVVPNLHLYPFSGSY